MVPWDDSVRTARDNKCDGSGWYVVDVVRTSNLPGRRKDGVSFGILLSSRAIADKQVICNQDIQTRVVTQPTSASQSCMMA